MTDIKISNIKSISQDAIVNIVANIIPVIVLQFVVLPLIGKYIGGEKYGSFLAILAIIHLIITITSGSLSNARLLLNKKYEQEYESGDYNFFLVTNALITIVVVASGCFFYSHDLSLVDIIAICFLSVIWMVKDYLIVEFRLSLSYTKILYNNVILALGFLIGLWLFMIFTHWYVIFLCGYLASFIHILINTSLLREPIARTRLFSQLSKYLYKIIIANIIGMIAVNFDRLLLFPLVGGTLVSVYYSASIIGKMMSLISSPISNVFLSHCVRANDISSNKTLIFILLITTLAGIALYIVCLMISPFILDLLYPSWSEESLNYVPITSAIAAFELIATIINPLALRFCNINYQIKIQSIYFLIYLITSLSLFYFFGMMGFASGILIATITKVCVIYYYTMEKRISPENV